MTFSADLSKWVAKAKGNTDKVVRKVVIDLGTSIVMKNPVGDGKYWETPVPKGYVGGRSRANWQYGNNVMPSGVIDSVDPSGQATITNLTNQILSSPTASMHYIANSVDYINRLEDGYSRQAPNGMVKLTVEKFQQTVRKSANGVS
jgi:hypothetical protein